MMTPEEIESLYASKAEVTREQGREMQAYFSKKQFARYSPEKAVEYFGFPEGYVPTTSEVGRLSFEVPDEAEFYQAFTTIAMWLGEMKDNETI